jgi:indole-3-glycerol phosphate synthase
MSSTAPTVLARIIQSTRAEVATRKLALPGVELQRRIEAGASITAARSPQGVAYSADRFRAALARPGVGVIAEFKRRSPSAGELRSEPDLAAIIGAYAGGGASAISVLTEQPNFGGSLEDLRLARTLCELPLLRKDFVIDHYQLLEARAAGADAVLLIVAALNDAELGELHSSARALGLGALVEVHDRVELDRALAIGARMIGVNNRDLRDFSVDIGRTFALRSAIPAEVLVVSESGIATAAQLRELAAAGIDAVLVGESLMRADDPAGALSQLLAYQDTDPENRSGGALRASPAIPPAGFSSPS